MAPGPFSDLIQTKLLIAHSFSYMGHVLPSPQVQRLRALGPSVPRLLKYDAKRENLDPLCA